MNPRKLSLGWAITWLSLLYWPVTLALATRKQFWNDELFTYYISALDTFPRIWSTLLTAVDQNPPLFYWLTHKATLIDPNLIGLRLPAMFGLWLAALCLMAFISKRLPPIYGLLAALILLESRAHWFAYEARPYGLVLGFATAALLCWQRSEGRRAILWTAGLAVSLSLALSVHYYSVLVFIPIAAAEACRTWFQKRLNWPVWIALTVAAASLLLYLPLIRSAQTYSGTFWAKAKITSILGFPPFIGTSALLALTGLALLWAVFASSAPRPAGDPPNRSIFPTPEIVAAFGMLFIVPIAVALGVFITGAYTERYAISAVIGLCFLIVWLLAAAFRAASGPALILAGVFSLAFMLQGIVYFSGPGAALARYDHRATVRDLENNFRSDFPIAVADPILFLELSHQASPQLRPRLFYIAEPKIALSRVTTNSVDRGLLGMQSLASLRVETLEATLARGESFLIIGYPAQWAWLVDELASRHVPLSVIGSGNGNIVLLAFPKN
ncbi:MAG: hypothetical protein ABIR70_10195 [Bryobacteraceae bacterium]